MTLSDTIGSEQIDMFKRLLGSQLCDSGLPKEEVEQAIRISGPAIARGMLAVVCKGVEAVRGADKTIIRPARVDRRRALWKIFPKGWYQFYGNDIDAVVPENVLAAVPQGDGDEVDVHFFHLDYPVSLRELALEHALRGLKPDLRAQAAVNENDREFSHSYPNYGCWLDPEGRWYSALFSWNGNYRPEVLVWPQPNSLGKGWHAGVLV